MDFLASWKNTVEPLITDTAGEFKFCPLEEVYVSWSSSSIYGGDSGNRIFVLYWRCSLIRVYVIRGSSVVVVILYNLTYLEGSGENYRK
jgi:hypothetical protein